MTSREVWPPAVPARSAGLALMGVLGHVLGVLLVLLLVGCVLVTVSDLQHAEDEYSGFGVLLSWLAGCGAVGLGAPLLTFRGTWQHLVVVSVPTFVLVSGLWREPTGLVVGLLASAVSCVWAVGLREASPSPTWTGGDWLSRAWLVGAWPAMVAGSAAWGGLGAHDSGPDDGPAELLALRFAALGESVLVLGPSALLALMAWHRSGTTQRLLLVAAAVASVVGMVFLRSGLNPGTA